LHASSATLAGAAAVCAVLPLSHAVLRARRQVLATGAETVARRGLPGTCRRLAAVHTPSLTGLAVVLRCPVRGRASDHARTERGRWRVLAAVLPAGGLIEASRLPTGVLLLRASSGTWQCAGATLKSDDRADGQSADHGC